MNGFDYRDGVLHVEKVPVPAIAERVGTPFYCYSTEALETAYRGFADAFGGDVSICYALKANSNLAVIRVLASLGAGADVVSAGELKRALAAGVPASRIVFSGVGKMREEMRFALETGIFQINVESVPELEALSEVASSMGVTAPIAVRVNPDVDARTHAKISTGMKENKFGIDIARAREVYARAAALPGIAPVSVAVHIGSQLTELSPFRTAFEKLTGLVRTLRADGHDIGRLDLGGGLGISYRGETLPTPAAYAEMVRDVTRESGCHVTVEPGRALVGNAGILVSRTIYRKDGEDRSFLILDAAMNDLIRPSLYDAWHTILPVAEAPQDAEIRPVDVVGPVCESGDTFAVQRPLPAIRNGELVAVLSAGAYGAVMASTYNTRPLIPEVLVNGSDFAVIRRRPSVEELMAMEDMPAWLR